MRTRNEIENEIEPLRSGSMTVGQVSRGEKLTVELLLDIRDLLNKTDKDGMTGGYTTIC